MLTQVRSHARRSEPPLDAFGEKIDEGRMIVGAGNLLKRLTTRAEEGVTPLLLKLLESFEAIGREGGGHHEKFFDSNGGQAFELVVSIRREPRFAFEPRLK